MPVAADTLQPLRPSVPPALRRNFSRPNTFCLADPDKKRHYHPAVLFSLKLDCSFKDGKEDRLEGDEQTLTAARTADNPGLEGWGGNTLNANAALENRQTGPLKCRACMFS